MFVGVTAFKRRGGAATSWIVMTQLEFCPKAGHLIRRLSYKRVQN